MNNKRKVIFFALLLVLLFAAGLAGCGGGGGSSAPLTAPTTPAGVVASPGNGQATIAWTAVPGATSYNIYWSTTTGVTPATAANKKNVTANTFIVTPLTNGTQYFFVVTAVNSSGESAPSSQVSSTPVLALTAPTGVTATPGMARQQLPGRQCLVQLRIIFIGPLLPG